MVVRGLVVVVVVMVVVMIVSVSVSVADLPAAGLVDGVGPRSVRDPRSGDFAMSRSSTKLAAPPWCDPSYPPPTLGT